MHLLPLFWVLLMTPDVSVCCPRGRTTLRCAAFARVVTSSFPFRCAVIKLRTLCAPRLDNFLMYIGKACNGTNTSTFS